MQRLTSRSKKKKEIIGVHSRCENPYWSYGWSGKNFLCSKCFSRATKNSKKVIKSYFFSRIYLVVFFFAQNAGILQQIHCRLAKEIHANAGVIHYINELRRSLNQLVQSEIFNKNYCSPKSNKRFDPCLKTIHSHIVAVCIHIKAIKKLR